MASWQKFGVIMCLLGLVSVANAASNQELSRTKTQLAVEYMRYNNLPTALQSANEAIEAYPTADAYLVKALITMQLNMDAESDQAFRQALRLDNQNPIINNNYGWFLCQRQQATQSIAYFDKALANPLYTTPETALLNKGICLEKIGELDQAAEALLAGLKKDPNQPALLNTMLRLRYQQNQPILALFYFQRLEKLNQNLTAEALYIGTKLAQQQGDAKQVKELKMKLQQYYPDSQENQRLMVEAN